MIYLILVLSSLVRKSTKVYLYGHSVKKKKKLARMLLIDNLLITSLIPILLFEYFKEKS